MGGYMQEPFSTSQLKRVFSYPFTSENSLNKIIVGLAVTLACFFIPVVPVLILYGYVYEIMHRIIVEKSDLQLPEWHNIGKLFKDGWRMFCVMFIYQLPMTFLVTAGFGMYIGAMIGLISQNDRNPQEGFLFGSIVFMILAMVCFMCGMIISPITMIILPPAVCHTVAKDRFSAGFDFSGWWRIFKANFGGFCLTIIIQVGLLGLIYFASQFFYMTIILIGIMFVLPILGWYYWALVISALSALVYREGMEKIEAVDAAAIAVVADNPALK
jgi:hypothetical protein